MVRLVSAHSCVLVLVGILLLARHLDDHDEVVPAICYVILLDGIQLGVLEVYSAIRSRILADVLAAMPAATESHVGGGHHIHCHSKDR